jgi:Leucine-rich repeat (LRR) protein
MLGDDGAEDLDQLSGWVQPLQTLSNIPSAQLNVKFVGSISDLTHPFIAQWLKQHGQLISHVAVEVHVSEDRLKLRDFVEAAAPCRSIELQIRHSPDEVVDLADLAPVARSLHRLTFQPTDEQQRGSLRGASAFHSMSQLTALHVHRESFGSEEPWDVLAELTSLQQLHLTVRASGDPSPLSALKALSSLHLQSSLESGGPAPFSLSSLQPLSTLQQLEGLHLGFQACGTTSLQGLAGLSNLKQLVVESSDAVRLASLEGISPGVIECSVLFGPDLVSLTGMERCTGLEKLSLEFCAVADLQPLRGLRSLKSLEVICCCGLTSLESLYSTSLQFLKLTSCTSLTRLSGVEHLSALKSLVVVHCGVTSLQPLSQLMEGLQELKVCFCNDVQEEVLELPHVQPTADVLVFDSNVREVVLAGGLRRAVRPA